MRSALPRTRTRNQGVKQLCAPPQLALQHITQEATPAFCPDFTTIARQLGFGTLGNTKLGALGKAVAKEYRRRTGREPLTTDKHVNGDIRKVKRYEVEHEDWVRELVRAVCTKT